MTIQFYTAFVEFDIGDLHLCIDQIAGAHGGQKLERLCHINGTMPRQLLSDYSRNQAGGQHPMGNPPFKDGILRIGVVQVHRITVGGHLGEHLDVFVGHDLAQIARHADFDIFDTDRSAGQIIQHASPFSNKVTPVSGGVKLNYFAGAETQGKSRSA